MDLTMTLSADQISLSAIVFTISDAGKANIIVYYQYPHFWVGYLLNLSKLVRSMKIVQCLMPGIAYPAEQCLFSVQGADWPSIFVEMFSNRLEKLYILNDMVTEYLSTKSAKFLGKVRLILRNACPRLPECDLLIKKQMNNDLFFCRYNKAPRKSLYLTFRAYPSSAKRFGSTLHGFT